MIKNIIIDFKRTIYDPESDSLLENSLEGLKLFKEKGFYVRLVGKGAEAEILSITKRHEIESFFDEICISDDKEKFFSKVDDPSSWLVIGDRALKEILFGGQLGMNTMWLKNGKFSNEGPTADQKSPDYTVSKWSEIMAIVKKI